MSERSWQGREYRAFIDIEMVLSGLTKLSLSPWPEDSDQISSLSIEISCRGPAHVWPDWSREMEQYFSGQPVLWSVLPEGQRVGGFTEKVLQLTRCIPWGEVRTYGWLSNQIKGRSCPRAVGGALKRNPWPLIIPCHRVIKEDGELGGFSSGRGWKQFLLGLESGKVPQINLEINKRLKR